MIRQVLVAVAVVTLLPAGAAAQKITKETLTAGGETRTYYVCAPERKDGSHAPLIVMLHGSNRDGKILLEHWQNLAEQEGIVLAGPDARQKMEWNVAPDGPSPGVGAAISGIPDRQVSAGEPEITPAWSRFQNLSRVAANGAPRFAPQGRHP